jgi:hypothetical protein
MAMWTGVHVRPTHVGQKKYCKINRSWVFLTFYSLVKQETKSYCSSQFDFFTPITPKKTYRKLWYVFFREAHTCHVSKVPPSHYLFYKTKCNNATHNATTNKTKRNSTHPFSTMGSAFMLMQHQSFINDFFLMMRAWINVTDKLANRCAKSCWIELDQQFEKIC